MKEKQVYLVTLEGIVMNVFASSEGAYEWIHKQPNPKNRTYFVSGWIVIEDSNVQ